MGEEVSGGRQIRLGLRSVHASRKGTVPKTTDPPALSKKRGRVLAAAGSAQAGNRTQDAILRDGMLRPPYCRKWLSAAASCSECATLRAARRPRISPLWAGRRSPRSSRCRPSSGSSVESGSRPVPAVSFRRRDLPAACPLSTFPAYRRGTRDQPNSSTRQTALQCLPTGHPRYQAAVLAFPDILRLLRAFPDILMPACAVQVSGELIRN